MFVYYCPDSDVTQHQQLDGSFVPACTTPGQWQEVQATSFFERPVDEDSFGALLTVSTVLLCMAYAVRYLVKAFNQRS